MVDYRALYEREVEPIDDDCEIHHINCDHSDNDLNNLVMIPKGLHYKWHKAYSEVLSLTWVDEDVMCFLMPRSLLQNGAGHNRWALDIITDYVYATEEINIWILRRDRKRGLFDE